MWVPVRWRLCRYSYIPLAKISCPTLNSHQATHFGISWQGPYYNPTVPSRCQLPDQVCESADPLILKCNFVSLRARRTRVLALVAPSEPTPKNILRQDTRGVQLWIALSPSPGLV